jgi:DNA polymerase elongation subunit (family B)
MKDLISRMVCTSETEACFSGKCDQYPRENLLDILINNSNIDLDDECSRTLWKKANNKFDCQQVTVSLDSLFAEIDQRWPAFLLHTYCNREQRDYIKELRTQSTDKTSIVAQIDFSINYTLLRQREVQQGFFSHHQATLFTIHLTVGQQHRNLAIISDCMEHTTSFVYCAQGILVQFVKKNFPLVKKINYV